MKDGLSDPILGTTYAWSRSLTGALLAISMALSAYGKDTGIKRWIEVVLACGAGTVSIFYMKRFIEMKVGVRTARKSSESTATRAQSKI